MDAKAPAAVEHFAGFQHQDWDPEPLHTLITYMSAQKLRTPKGLSNLQSKKKGGTKNAALLAMQQFHNMHCALWSESIWCIVDASASRTKFIVSDHPVTIYNRGCYPGSRWCRGTNDPSIAMTGSHTIFPLSLDKALVMTNLSWARNPYENPVKKRPHPEMIRPAMFRFTTIQINRQLSEEEVRLFNFVIKSRAHRYIAACQEEWLHPEDWLPGIKWPDIGESYLFMPDPRSMGFSSEVVIGFKDGSADGTDEYGRKPWHSDYTDKQRFDREWASHQAFEGEYARLFGPRRRGVTFEFGSLATEQDSDTVHAARLQQESIFKPRVKARRRRGHR